MAADPILDKLFISFPNGVEDEYAPLNGLYQGWNACLIFAHNLNTGMNVMLKLYRRLYEEREKALAALRDIKYASKLSHPNVLKALNICGKKRMLYTDVFLELELTGINLLRLLASPHVYFTQPADQKSLMRQILLGLAYIHSADLVHRDLKPTHILYIPTTRSFKIGDFSSARKTGDDVNNMTKCIRKSCYSAPEVILCPHRLTTSADIYSAGLILIQVLRITMRPFLEYKPGMIYIEQIFQKTGSPTEDDLRDLPTDQARYIMEKISSDYPRRTWAQIFPTMTAQETDLIDQMLQFSSSSRTSALGALECAYFDGTDDYGPDETIYMGPILEDYRDLSFPEILTKIRESITVDITTPDDTDQLRPFAGV